jgi:hypothetical protein
MMGRGFLGLKWLFWEGWGIVNQERGAQGREREEKRFFRGS